MNVEHETRRKKGEGRGWHTPKIYATALEFGHFANGKDANYSFISKPFLRPALRGVDAKIKEAFKQ